MKFTYEGFDNQGQPQRGALDAPSVLAALQALQSRNITAISVLPESEPRHARLLTPRLTRRHLAQALHELTRLIESEVALSEAINAIAEAGHHPEIDRAFRKIARALQHGESFSTALANCSLPLPDYVHHLVRAGELTGDLAAALKRSMEKMEYDERTATELRNALTYPLILVGAGLAAVILMFIVVVPKFSSMLGKDNSTLPWLAHAVLSTGVWFNAYWQWLLGTLLLTGLAAGLSLRHSAVRQSLLNASARMPILGTWLNESDMASWSYTLSAMLACKVELLAALTLSLNAVRIPRRQTAMHETIRLVRSGKSVAVALDETQGITRTGINLIKVGERTGRLAEMLNSLATLYEDNSKNRMKKMLTLIEPIAILAIGTVIGTIILGIILAITSVNDMAL